MNDQQNPSPELNENKILSILNTLDETTRNMAIEMLTLSVYPTEAHPQTAPIIQTLVQCITVDTPSDNPIINAANAVNQIYKVAHGQQEMLQDIIEIIMMEYINFAA